jgi:hypothetical protein
MLLSKVGLACVFKRRNEGIGQTSMKNYMYICKCFYGWKFVKNFGMKIYSKCFRPKWCFFKSIPGQGSRSSSAPRGPCWSWRQPADKKKSVEPWGQFFNTSIGANFTPRRKQSQIRHGIGANFSRRRENSFKKLPCGVIFCIQGDQIKRFSPLGQLLALGSLYVLNFNKSGFGYIFKRLIHKLTCLTFNNSLNLRVFTLGVQNLSYCCCHEFSATQITTLFYDLFLCSLELRIFSL